MKLNLFVATLFTAFNLFAASAVEFSGTPKIISASGKKVLVYPELKIKQAGDADIALKLSGAGLRKKEVFFVPVNVYVAASYVADPTVFTTSSPLEGLQASPVRVLKLTMLRSLSGSEIRQSFEEALKFNGIDINQTAFVNVFSQFTVDASSGDTFTIICTPHGALEHLIVEMPSKNVTEDGKDLGLDFLKVWFGKSVDSGLEDLQKQLVGKK